MRDALGDDSGGCGCGCVMVLGGEGGEGVVWLDGSVGLYGWRGGW